MLQLLLLLGKGETGGERQEREKELEEGREEGGERGGRGRTCSCCWVRAEDALRPSMCGGGGDEDEVMSREEGWEVKREEGTMGEKEDGGVKNNNKIR